MPWSGTCPRLLRAPLLQVFYSIRRERLLMEPLDDTIWCRGVVGRARDDPIGVPTVCTKNRDRLRNQDVARGQSPPPHHADRGAGVTRRTLTRPAIRDSGFGIRDSRMNDSRMMDQG